jgi:putative MATE family efflux protein
MSQTRDMTQGKPLGLLLGFAWPILLSSLCQQLYTIADSLVVGRLLGVSAFAAVGATGFFSWLFIDILVGLAQGFGILFAQRFGAGDKQGLYRSVALSCLMGLGFAVVLTAAGLLLAPWALQAMRTPAELLEPALSYLRWILSGLTITFFNRLAGILLQALGNSKAPFYGVILSTLSNLLLDVLFVAGFSWGVAGAAAATVLAQLLSLCYCLFTLKGIFSPDIFRRKEGSCLPLCKELLRLGGPLAFRNGVISFGGLFVQSAINPYGSLFVAGITASQKYFDFLQLPAGALDGSFATYSAQNFGKGCINRIKKGFTTVTILGLTSCAAAVAVILLFGKPMLGFLVTGTPEELSQMTVYGYESFLGMCIGMPFLYMLYLYRSGLQGMGASLSPMFSGFLELSLRLFSVFFLPSLLGEWSIYLANPLGWVAACLYLGLCYHSRYRKVSGNTQKTEK